ncbi:MAG: helix-turn-helix domain-containing protein [Rickettsiales bacterium]
MEKELFESLMRGARETADYTQGKPVEGIRVHVPKKVNVKATRKKLKMTQKTFAETFGFSLQSVKYWESNRREPEAAAKVLLNTIAYSPETVIMANR